MSEHYELLRALHIISVIFWMAGMLYLPRLYVYHSTAIPGGEADEMLKTQERKLLRIIVNPAMIAAVLLGLILIGVRSDALTGSGWLHVKLLLVFGLTAYHGFLASVRKKFEAGQRPYSEKFFRIINEVPALVTIAVVLLAVLEPF